MSERPYADPSHPGNALRPRVRCIGCGTLGCTTAWGPWCFACNVRRIDRISGFLESELKRLQPTTAQAFSSEGPGT